MSARRNWPYLVERPGRGQVRACPVCGAVAIFNCRHNGQRVRTVVMNAARAAWLRRTSGEYETGMVLTCTGCGYVGPPERGSTLGANGWHCAACSGKTPRQVAAARRQLA